MERFWSKVNKTDTCWLWTANTVPYGYGRIKVNGVSTGTHRVAWEMENGPIPDGLYVLHRCDVPSCVRPAHLYLGTQADNRRDAMARSVNPQVFGRGEINPAAKLTPDSVNEIRARLAAGATLSALAREHGVHREAIAHIKYGRNWAWLTPQSS